MRAGIFVAVAAASLAAACTGSSAAPPSTESSSESSTEPSGSGPPPAGTEAGDTGPAGDDVALPPPVVVAEGPAIVDGAANSLILVLDGRANALTAYRADGTIAATYPVDAGELVSQPVWAPDGRRVAWTRTSDGLAWELVTSSVDGAEQAVVPLPGRPDYITFDPTATRVLALTPSPDGFGLVIVDLDDTGGPPGGIKPIRVVDIGQPYFSDFAPDGDRVIAHVGSELRVVGLDGERQPLGLQSIGHQAPAWHPADDLVFFAADDDGENRLVAFRPADATSTELAAFNGFLLFDLDPMGERLAVSVFGPDGDAAVVALRGSPRRAQPAALGGGLWLVDAAGGGTTRLADAPTAAPMWDPTGSRVLARAALDGAARWVVYGLDGAETGTADFDVSRTMLPAYLPFWDQYARSQTLWSPDGRQFTHVGRSAAGASGVWVHDAATTGPSTFLADGDLAFWSPT